MHDHLGADLTRLAAQLDRGTGTVEPPPGSMPASVTVAEWQNSAQQAVKTLDELVWATNPTQDRVECQASYLAEFGPGHTRALGLLLRMLGMLLTALRTPRLPVALVRGCVPRRD